MRNILQKQQPYLNLIRMIEYREYSSGVEIRDLSLLKEIIPYKVFIPSFSGESMFLLLKHSEPNKDFNFNEAHSLNSHITEDVWISYKTINW
jgi:hypothetical protein